MSTFSYIGYSTCLIEDDHIKAYVKSLRIGGEMTVRERRDIYSPKSGLEVSTIFFSCFTRDYSFTITMNIETLQVTPLVIHIDINISGLCKDDDMFEKVNGFTIALFKMNGIIPSCEEVLDRNVETLICTPEEPCALCLAELPNVDNYTPPPIRRVK